VRWDGGIATGVEVGLSYDPMLAKLIVHAPTRLEAVERMKRALLELRIEGVDTSVPFHLRVMDEPDFRAGRLTSATWRARGRCSPRRRSDEVAMRVAALAAALLEEERRTMRGVTRARAGGGGTGRRERMARGGGWRAR
jgi:acetyl-CoA carboxylase biotin carboxylase subunit